jgi:hypothetical protein
MVGEVGELCVTVGETQRGWREERAQVWGGAAHVSLRMGPLTFDSPRAGNRPGCSL